MKDPDLFEEDDSHTAAFALADLTAQSLKQGFDVLPGNIGAGWVSEDRFKRAPVLAFHVRMVLNCGTDCKSVGCREACGSLIIAADPPS